MQKNKKERHKNQYIQETGIARTMRRYRILIEGTKQFQKIYIDQSELFRKNWLNQSHKIFQIWPSQRLHQDEILRDQNFHLLEDDIILDVPTESRHWGGLLNV